MKLSQKQLENIWNQVPPDYYEKQIAINPIKRVWHTFKVLNFKNLSKNIRPNKILDVGCASGRMANEVSKIFPHAQITAIDVYKKSISYGKRAYPHINFLVADAHKLPFRANSFDLVITYEVIEHLVDPLIALKQMRRVVKKEGLVIVVMDSGSTLFRIVWWVSENTVSRVWKGAHLHPYTHSQLQKVIKKAGFKIVKKQFSHFGMEVSFVLKK